MTTLYCGHDDAVAGQCCKHVLKEQDPGGIKRFNGRGLDGTYLCYDCCKKPHSLKNICQKCLDNLEENGYWGLRGEPEIKKLPRNFSFEKRRLHVKVPGTIVKYIPCHGDGGDAAALLLTTERSLWHINVLTGELRELGSYSAADIPVLELEPRLSANNRYLALTWILYKYTDLPDGSQSKQSDVNGGLLIDCETGQIAMRLSCGDYRTGHASFPVAFFERDGHTLMVHGTNWNQVDVTDLNTGECLTERDDSRAPDEEFKQHTPIEWYGELQISPDQQFIASIGWVWHPIGSAVGWDLQKWLHNCWEAEHGLSAVSYASWEYFWFSPFVWLDNERLLIWGYDRWLKEGDPTDSVAIYNGRTGEELSWFPGPTMDVFVFDGYLFSGIDSGENYRQGLSVWDLEEGALLCEAPEVAVDAYQRDRREFVAIEADNRLIFQRWREDA